MSNNPPYVTLELSKSDAIMLRRLLLRDHAMVQNDFREVCEMSGSDPRAKHRATASLMLSVDMDWDEAMAEKMAVQQPDLIDETADYAKTIKRKAAEQWVSRARKFEDGT